MAIEAETAREEAISERRTISAADSALVQGKNMGKELETTVSRRPDGVDDSRDKGWGPFDLPRVG